MNRNKNKNIFWMVETGQFIYQWFQIIKPGSKVSCEVVIRLLHYWFLEEFPVLFHRDDNQTFANQSSLRENNHRSTIKDLLKVLGKPDQTPQQFYLSNIQTTNEQQWPVSIQPKLKNTARKKKKKIH